MASPSTSNQQHWYLKLIVGPLLRSLRSIAPPPRQVLANVPSSSGAPHWYVRLVFNPLLGLLKFVAVISIQLFRFISHGLRTFGQFLILLQRLIINPLLRSPHFILVFTSELLKFKPNQLTPGRYALETVGRWPRQFMGFFPALFRFFVSWGEERPRFLNRITLLAPVSASLSLFSLVILKASFLTSFLELHFPTELNLDVVKLPPLS